MKLGELGINLPSVQVLCERIRPGIGGSVCANDADAEIVGATKPAKLILFEIKTICRGQEMLFEIYFSII